MQPFFLELVTDTDEARRTFETNPVVLDAVAKGMSVERYRKLLHELYHIVWHFNPVCAAGASRMPDNIGKFVISCMSTCMRSRVMKNG